MRFLRRLLTVILLLALAILSFFLWSSSNTLEKKDYAKIMSYPVETDTIPDSIFTIITYNIGYLSGMANNTSQTREENIFSKRLAQVNSAFAQYQPDFIGLQEVDFMAARSFNVNQMDSLAQAMGMQAAAMAVNWDKRYVPFPYYPPTQHFGKMLSGQAILSKYPIRLHDRIELKRPDNPFWYDAFYLDRLAQIATIQVNGQDIIVINVHLEAYDKAVRDHQSQAVLELYKNYAKAYPTLLIGDFNSEPPHAGQEKPSLTTFLDEPKLKSACPPSHFRKTGSFTFPSVNPDQHIDFIFYHEDQFEMVDWKVIEEVGTASDHLPVMMKFKFKN